MKVLFIHCNIRTGNGPHFVPGIGSMSSVLKQAGHETGLLFLQEPIDRDTLLDRVAQEKPDLIGFSTLTIQWNYIRQYTRWIREAFSIPIIHGGIHATVTPEEVIAQAEVDLVCLGEGEFPLLDLLERLEKGVPYDDIPNLWIKKPGGEIIRNPLRPLIQDLDALPFPDRDLFDYRRLLLENPREATLLMAGRGCPFACKYCVNNAFHRLYRGLGKYVRMRSQERVLEEIRFLREKHGIDRLFIYDDTFTYDHHWLHRFCDLYEKEFRLPFSINVRIDTVNDEVLRRLREAGCEMIVVGIESGSERIRREIMGRKMTNEQIIRFFRTTEKLGIRTWTNNMIGLPTETPAEAEETIALNRLIRPDNAQIFVFYPFPGTELHDLSQREGYLSERVNTSLFEGDSVLNLPTLSTEQIRQYTEAFKKMAFGIKLEKERAGIYDFVLKFSEARVSAGGDNYVQITSAIINGEERVIIFAHPESRITYFCDLPEKARLCFGLALSPYIWSPEKGTGVDFEILLTQDGEEKKVFSRYIDPKNRPEDRKWHDLKVDLPDLRPGLHQIDFVTTTKGRDNQCCWAMWSHPFLDISA